MNGKLPKVSRPDPETMSQALHWDAAKRRYLRAGLCELCASHAASGHQCGFSTIAPPCEACVPIVATFPTEAAGEWRKVLSAPGALHDDLSIRAGQVDR